MLTLYHIYNDWDKVLQHTYFEPDSLIEDLKKAFNRYERLKAVLLDDVSLWLIRFSYREKFNVWFGKLFNLMRSLTAGVIMTSVELTDIVKLIRGKVIYRIPITQRQGFNNARVYRVYTTPKLEKAVKKVFIDRYTLDMIPGDIRQYYEDKRREALKRLFNELDEIQGKDVDAALNDLTSTLENDVNRLLLELQKESRDYPVF